MKTESSKKSTLCNFIMKLCSIERFIEIKRQLLCDKPDFEPYTAFQRLSRDQSSRITPETITNFMSESMVVATIDECQRFISHYSSSQESHLGYKEFLDVILPKEHPDLRAFITQRECFDMDSEEYFCYETEMALANLIELECRIYD